MDGQYYIRVRGRVLGPYDQDKLQALARRGQFSRLHEISHDGAIWERAAEHPELFTSLASVLVEAGPVHDPRGGGSGLPAGGDWYYSQHGAQAGPVGFTQLQALASMGQLAPSDLVWSEGREWTQASLIPGLGFVLAGSNQGQAAAPSLPEDVWRAAVASKPWVLFVTVCLFLSAACTLVGSVYYLTRADNNRDIFEGVSGLLTGGAQIWVAALLLVHHNRLGQLMMNRDPAALREALAALKTYWVVQSIVIIILIAMVAALVIYVAALGGAAMRN